jgi:hypothetical protein
MQGMRERGEPGILPRGTYRLCRKARQEISLHNDPQFLGVDWNDEDGSTSAAYVTANDESDGAFVTATENEMDETS